jgi:hypothetical protein
MKECYFEQHHSPATPANVDAICDAFEAAWLFLLSAILASVPRLPTRY